MYEAKATPGLPNFVSQKFPILLNLFELGSVTYHKKDLTSTVTKSKKSSKNQTSHYPEEQYNIFNIPKLVIHNVSQIT